MTRRWAGLLCSALALAAGGCVGRHPWSWQSVCEAPRDPGREPDGRAYLALLLQGWDPATRRATSPPVDCSGAQVRWDGPALACEDGATARSLLPDRPLGPDDVIVSPLDDAIRLVWVVTNRFASGDALGPAAIVELRHGRLVVRALGPLRANPLRARLRLERLAGSEALVAEGDQCASADPASCVRGVRVLPIRGERLVSRAVRDAAGACVSPAWFDVSREDAERLPSGWRRRTRLGSALAFGPSGISLDEQVLVEDVDPRQPAGHSRLFRKAQSRLEIRLVDGELVTTGRTLWSRMHRARE